MIFYVLDKDENLKTVLSNEDITNSIIFSAVVTEELNKMSTLEMDISAVAPESQYLAEENYILFKDLTNEWQFYTIKEVTSVHELDRTKHIYCEHSSQELIDYLCDIEIKDTSYALSVLLTDLLAQTRWEMGNIDITTNTYTDTTLDKSVLETLNIIKNFLHYNLKFRFEVTGNAITGRYVDMNIATGRNLGKRFEYGKDIEKIQKVVDTTDLKTALKLRGKNGIETYVEDTTATAQWGYKSANVRLPRVQFYENKDIETVADLATFGTNLLATLSKPKISYTMDIIDLFGITRDTAFSHESVKLGDIVKIIDREFTVGYKNSRNITPNSFIDWESGHYSITNGAKEAYASRIRLKNLIKVMPNTVYYVNTNDTNATYDIRFVIRALNSEKGFVRSIGGLTNGSTFTTGDNEWYIAVSIYETTDVITYDDWTACFANGEVKPYICLNSDSHTYIGYDSMPNEDIELTSYIIQKTTDLLVPANSEVKLGDYVFTVADYNSNINTTMDKKIEQINNGSYEDIQALNQQMFEESSGFTYLKDTEGLWVYNNPVDQNPTKVVAIKGGQIAIASWDEITSSWKVSTFIDGNSVNASAINTGVLLADLIKAGILQSEDGSSWIDMETGDFNFKNLLKFTNGSFTINYAGTAIADALALKADQSSLDTMYNFLTFDDVAGLTIGKSGSAYKITIDNDDMSFYNGTNIVAKITGQVMTIDTIELTTSMKVGVHMIKRHASTNITLITFVG